jgi:RND family efflux transporter MFP subunit
VPLGRSYLVRSEAAELNYGKSMSPALMTGAALVMVLAGCSDPDQVRAGTAGVTVGVVDAARKPVVRQLTVSSELVPFQQIDIYAKESGFVKNLMVDYGSRVRKDQLLAILEIPELEAQLKQDDAAIKSQQDIATQAQYALEQVQAQETVYRLQYTRLKGVADSRPGMVAQQEVDDAQGKDLAAQAQAEAARSNLRSAQAQFEAAKAKRERDLTLYEYSRIMAPFAGVITQRYANLGTLVQSGTNSSTNVLPIVRLSQDSLFRLVIPIAEGYVKYIRIGDPVSVLVPSLNRRFSGKVARFSVEVTTDTRTMHTEVDVPNPTRVLMPGVYAQATLTLERKNDALTVALQAINHQGDQTTVDVVTPGNRIEERPVVLGLQTASDVEVVSGLREGEAVVVSDRAALKSGQIVRPHKVEMVGYKPQS